MYPQFIGISGWVKGQVFKAELRLGRDPDCDVQFQQGSRASRQHAMTEIRDGQLIIRDLGSTNGTSVNGARMAKYSERVLHHGDVVKIDDCRFVFLERAEVGGEAKGGEDGEAERNRRMATIRVVSLEETIASAPKDVAVALIQALSAIKNLRASQDILRRILEAVLDMIHLRRLAVVIIGDSPEVYRSEFYHDLASGSTERFEMNRAILRQVLREPMPVLSNDGDSVLCVPLVTIDDEAPFGFIYIQDPDPDAFHMSTQMLLTGIADLASSALRQARERESVEERNIYLAQRAAERAEEKAGDAGRRQMIGSGAKAKEMRQMIVQVAQTGVSVLITGESGTGKELAAHAIYENSPRRAAKFVDVNCAAIPEELKESELFGHEKGAFTGALSQRIGKFEAANGGTLFLDEVGDTSPRLQAALLRAIQEREIQRVGGTKTIRVDVRLIAATNRNLLQMVREGRFREDLYYRLKVVELRMPSLSERKEDIAELADYFVEKHRETVGKAIIGLAFGAEQVLLRQEWKGNVRELENTILAAMVFARSDRITRDDLRRVLEAEPPVEHKPGDTYASFIERSQRWIMEWGLRQTNQDVSAAAKLLDLDSSYVYRMIKNLGIDMDR